MTPFVVANLFPARPHSGTLSEPAALSDPADRELVAAFLEDRDEQAFRALYRRHAPALHLFVLRFLGRADGAEDVLQETWVRATTRLPTFRWGASLRTWLTGIAVNCCRERFRRAGPVPTLDDVPEPAHVSQDDVRVDLEAALRELPDGSRAVLLLHDVEGYTHAEIGRLLEIDEGTSKSQLFRARSKVRKRLDGRRP